MANQTQEAPALLRRKQVEARTGLSRSSIYAGIAAGTFPKPCPLSDTGRSVAWLESEISAWVAARVSARGVQS